MIDNTINIFGYPIEKIDSHPSISFLWNDYPTLTQMVKNSLLKREIYKDKKYNCCELPKNIDFDLELYNKNLLLLKDQLEQLINISWWKKPIIFVSDWCFTNELFIRELWEILWYDYDKFVNEVSISYNDNSLNNHLNNFMYENSIIIIWWSYTNIEEINPDVLNWDFLNFIKKILYNKINSKVIWICWWYQLVSHIIWLNEVDSEKIMTTYLWEAQFWTMPWKLAININNIPYVYRNALYSITKNWDNQYINSVLTRTWHIVDNLIWSFKLLPQSLFPIVIDPITWSNRIWWSTNWQFFWVQDHFEINPATDTDLVLLNLLPFIQKLTDIYWKKINNILNNFEIQRNISNITWRPMYAWILSWFANSIIQKYHFFSNESKQEYWKKHYSLSWENLESIILEENFWESKNILSSGSFFERLDNHWILKILPILDWSISRGVDEVSEILWIDLISFIKNHKSFLEYNSINTWNYVIRDLWAWKWELINEIQTSNNLKLNTIIYWISDYAYFNIYEWLILLNNSGKLSKFIPENIIKIFVEELIEIYKWIWDGNEKGKIIQTLSKIRLKATKFKICTMFSKNKTYKFNDNEDSLTQNEIQFLENNSEIIDELKEYIKNNFYELVIWDYSKIIFWNFNSSYILNKIIKQVDLLIAIRSTSHIDSSSLLTVWKNFIDIFAKPWSIFIENWIIRSDSWVPRINEIIQLWKNNNLIRILFIYDNKTSYITWAIINKFPFFPMNQIPIDDNHILLSPEEIEECSFFKLERLFRELLIFTFKDLKYNHDKNKQIMHFLKFLSNEISLNNNCNIKELIINEINRLIDEINEEYNKQYLKMDINIFNLYLNKLWDKKVIELVNQWIFVNPIWFNKNFERNN